MRGTPRRLLARRAPSLLQIGVLVCLPTRLWAVEAKLAWDPNAPEETVTGYRVFYDVDPNPPYQGAFADQGSSPLDLPLTTMDDPAAPQVLLTGLPACTDLYFSVTAYNDAAESDYATELATRLAPRPKDVAIGVEGPGRLRVSWTIPDPRDRAAVARYLIYTRVVDARAADGGDAKVPDPEDFSEPAIELWPTRLDDPTHPSTLLSGLPAGVELELSVASACASGEQRLTRLARVSLPAAPDDPSGDLHGGCALAPDGGESSSTGWTASLLLLLALARRRRRR